MKNGVLWEEVLHICASVNCVMFFYIHMRIGLAVGTKHEAVGGTFWLLAPLYIRDTEVKIQVPLDR